MLEGTGKDRTSVVTIFYVFKRSSNEMEDAFLNQLELLQEVRNATFKIKKIHQVEQQIRHCRREDQGT